MAIYLGHPKITVGYYIWKSMIPAALGNIVGGGLFVAVVYWYLFLVGDSNPITIDGDNWTMHAEAMAAHETDVSSSSSAGMGTEHHSHHHGHHDQKMGKTIEEIA